MDIGDLIGASALPMLLVDRDWNIAYGNASAQAMLGEPQRSVEGVRVWDALSEFLTEPFHSIVTKAREERTQARFDVYLPPSSRWYEVHCQGFDDGVYLVFHDITERREAQNDKRRAEEAQRTSEMRYAGIIASAMDAIVSIDDNQRIQLFNPAAEKMFGYAAHEVMGQPLDMLLPERFRARHADDIRRFGESGVTARNMRSLGQLVARHKVGVEFPIEAAISHAKVGDQVLYTAVVRDISERLYAESERDRLLRETAEMARRQRTFLRDVLFSVTEGRLRLCDTADDLPAPRNAYGESVALTRSSLAVARRFTELAAEGVGLPKDRMHDLITAVGEATMNAVVHAGGGSCQVCADTEAGTVQVWIRDAGTGISESALHHATLERGWTTAGTLGHGFFMMLHTADRVYLLTGAAGTTVVIEQERSAPLPAWLESSLAAAASL